MTDLVGSAPAPAGIMADFENLQDVLLPINMINETLTIAAIVPFFMLRLYIRAFDTRIILIEDSE
jgi:hypothetical protein